MLFLKSIHSNKYLIAQYVPITSRYLLTAVHKNETRPRLHKVTFKEKRHNKKNNNSCLFYVDTISQTLLPEFCNIKLFKPYNT